jgi:ferrous iron transport protein A
LRIILNMNLLELPVAVEKTIETLTDELREDFKTRLREIGFREGALVQCLRKTPFGGPGVYLVSGSVFSLDSALACHIRVQET